MKIKEIRVVDEAAVPGEDKPGYVPECPVIEIEMQDGRRYRSQVSLREVIDDDPI